MAKLEIATTTHSTEEVATIMTDYTTARLVKRTQLFGGYSGSNYRVDLDDGSTYVLKITNGYSVEHAELMCRTAYHLEKTGYKDACFPIPKATDSSSADQPEFVSTKEKSGVPAFLLIFVEGQQADRVMREHPKLATTVMRCIGGGLARMHAAASGIEQTEANKFGLRWYQTDGGCCDVQDQIMGHVMEKVMVADSTEVRDIFLDFGGMSYKRELESLRSEMKLASEGKIANGILHGDPFADNVLVNPKTGTLSAFIDIEDFCVGPLLFDLACCAIGCCFVESSSGTTSSGGNSSKQVLDLPLFAALLQGYCSDRKLTQTEKEHLVPYMRLTLLCNCSWRFVKFNVGTSADLPDEAKNSYVELQDRIAHLHDPEALESITKLIEEHGM